MTTVTLITVEDFGATTVRACASIDAALRWYRDVHVTDYEWTHYFDSLADSGEAEGLHRVKADNRPLDFIVGFVGDKDTTTIEGVVHTIFGEETDYVVTVWQEEVAV